MQVRISLVLQFIRLMGLLTAQLNLEGRTRFVQRRLRLEPCVVDIGTQVTKSTYPSVIF